MGEPVQLFVLKDQLLEQIADSLAESKQIASPARATALRDLAEAWAGLVAPAQPHGGSAAK